MADDILRAHRSFTDTNTPGTLPEGQIAINAVNKKIWMGNTSDVALLIFDGVKLDGIEAGADVTSTNETSHADVVVDGDFPADGFLIRNGGSGNYSVDTNTYSQTGHAHQPLLAGVGLSGTTYDGSTSSTFNLALDELTDMTAPMVDTDEFIVLDGGTAERRKAANEIDLSIFGIAETGLRIRETADHPITPAATIGQLWVKNTTPNKLYFTDDAGTDHDLTASAADHGALTGLGDDDHTQYLLVAGTRAMTGTLDMGSQNIEVADNKGIVDGEGNLLLAFRPTSGSDNHVSIYNSFDPFSPSILAEGTPTNISLQIDGKGTGKVFTFSSSFEVAKDLVLKEQSDHTETPTAGSGQLWVKNDAPNELIFTDDTGIDRHISKHAITSATAPTNPYDGMLWWNSEEGNLYIYYEDATEGHWISATNLIAGKVDSESTVGFSAYVGTNQSISNATTTIVDFDTEKYDIGGDFDTTTNKFTVPPGKAGKYLVNYALKIGIINDQERCYSLIFVNGGQVSNTEFRASGVAEQTVTGVDVLDLDVGDEVDIRIYVNAADTVNAGSAGTRFQMYYLDENRTIQLPVATDTEIEVGTSNDVLISPKGLADVNDVSGMSWVVDQDSMSSDSALLVPTQQSVKAYVDKVPAQTLFRLYKNGSQSLSSNTITKVTSWGATYNIGSDFNLTNSNYVVPVAGYYYFEGHGTFDTAADSDRLRVYIYRNGGNLQTTYLESGGAAYNTLRVSTLRWCNVSDTIDFRMHNGDNADTIPSNQAYFHGWYLGTGA